MRAARPQPAMGLTSGQRACKEKQHVGPRPCPPPAGGTEAERPSREHALARTRPGNRPCSKQKIPIRRASEFPAGPSAPSSIFCCYVGERSALSNPDQRSLESKQHRAACKRRIFGEFSEDFNPDFHRGIALPCKCPLSSVDALLKACESPKEKPSACTTGRAHHLLHFHFGAASQNLRGIFSLSLKDCGSLRQSLRLDAQPPGKAP